MDCAEEVAALKQEVGPLVKGHGELVFDVMNAKMGVYLTDDQITSSMIIDAVARTGMRADPWKADTVAPVSSSFWELHGRTVLTVVSGVFLAAGFLSHALLAGGIKAALGSEGMAVAQGIPIVTRILYGCGIVAGSWHVIPKAFFSVRRLRPDMNLLMFAAVVGALIINEWFEAATVAFLFAVSLTLEAWSVGRARKAVAALLSLTPPKARVMHDGHEHEMDVAEVKVGSHVLVKPGEKIPLDGEVENGSSDVNQAPITGESAPVSKGIGATVFAGTINETGALEIKTTKDANATALAGIIRMVSDAQSRRAPSEQWVERFAKIYTPVIMALALAVALIPPLVFGAPWTDWFYRALVLLVIGCPCALVISTPVSIVAALAASARNGVLVKGGEFLEIPSGLKAIAFDKTGTLTRGTPAVAEIIPLNGHTELELLERAAAMETRSEHPLAKAILDYAKTKGLNFKPCENFQIIKGKGATATFDGRQFWVGSHRYLEDRGQETPEVHAQLEALSKAGRSIIVIGNESHVCGFIALSDAVRSETASVVKALRADGIEHIIMLTGDNRGTAAAIGAEAGIDEVKAELLPDEKVKTIEELLLKYGSVAMVGDGVNDAPALARATLGIAMGAMGSDAAIETADVALMTDDLSKLPWLIRHSRRTLRIIQQNIWFALTIKAVFFVLTLSGHASLWAAIAADMGASFIVIFNGLRLLKVHQVVV